MIMTMILMVIMVNDNGSDVIDNADFYKDVNCGHDCSSTIDDMNGISLWFLKMGNK